MWTLLIFCRVQNNWEENMKLTQAQRLVCGPDVTMPHVAMNDSMPRRLQKTHSVYHQAKPVSISRSGDLFPWSLTLIMWDLLILKFMNSQSNLFQICFISRALDFCPGNALFQLQNIWLPAQLCQAQISSSLLSSLISLSRSSLNLESF